MVHIVQPLAINPVRVSGHRVDSQSVDAVLGFFIINILLVIGGSLVMTIISDMDIFSAFMSIVATVWNIGPSFGTVGPVDNYGHISDAGKWFLSFNMLVGRMEVFTVLVIFTPYFWKR